MQTENQNRMNKQLFFTFLILFGCFVIAGIVYTKLWQSGTIDVPCPIYEKLHIYCPACGLSRAFAYLFEGEIYLSIKANLMMLVTIIFFGGYVLTQVVICMRFRLKDGKKEAEEPFYIGFPDKLFKVWLCFLFLICLIKNLTAV